MHLLDGRPVYSATDLVGFLACPHLTNLERAALAGTVHRPPDDDAELDAIRRRGFEHERRYRSELEARGRRVTEIQPDAYPDLPDGAREGYAERLHRQVTETLAAMRRGDDVIYQAAFFDGTWRGHADFLLREEVGSALGAWSYTVADTKLAHHAKASAILQLCSYVEQLAAIQGHEPEHVTVALGGSERRVERFRVADAMAYYRTVKRRFLSFVEGEHAPPVAYPPVGTEPDPVEHCDVCRWIRDCKGRWRREDGLPLVAGITRTQRRGLRERGVGTRRGLAVLELPPRPPIAHATREGIERVREQARLQVEGEDAGRPLHELLPLDRLPDGAIIPERGLGLLPPPSVGDLFFDIEGDPLAFDDGLEYLFGVLELEPDPERRLEARPTLGLFDPRPVPRYRSWMALDKAAERRMFEAFVDYVTARLRLDPNLHVFHYGAYERTRLARLSTRHATREDEVDRLLRGEVLVDLFRVVRQGIRASTESYSIKALEPLYGFVRQIDLRTAGESIVQFERWLDEGGGDPALLEQIERYNEDDCRSTWWLRDWLEERRREARSSFGVEVPRPTAGDPSAGREVGERERRADEIRAALLDPLPPEPERSPEHRAQALLAELMDWHRREDKAFWWRYFELRGLNDEELVESRDALGGLRYDGEVGTERRSLIHRYTFPPQDTEIRRKSEVHDPVTGKPPGTIVEIDELEGWVTLKRAAASQVPHPSALIPHDYFDPREMQDALFRLGGAVAASGLGDRPDVPELDLLLRRPPRLRGVTPGEPLTTPGESAQDAAVRLAPLLDGTVLAIQGPPGSGKTTTGARMVVALVQAGMTVGVTATSHKVIGNLLDEVCRTADRASVDVHAIQRVTEDGQRCSAEVVRATRKNADVVEALESGSATIAAGTAWLWSREEMSRKVDVLFVDEAGQMSLANVLAVAQGARNIVLLGDPQQLEQPRRGAHPPGADASALSHLLGDAQTIPEHAGLFLERTWRLHPAICRFTSELFYEGRLSAEAAMVNQTLADAGPFTGSGLRWVPVEHRADRSESAEEAVIVTRLVRALTSGATWTSADGTSHPIGLRDVLVVAPYNAQVAAIARLLPPETEGTRVGTVDRFQGQQAPVVIYSLTTSSPEDAPRGLEFLYSLNRLNVATSRARCMAIVVGNPRLLDAYCRTPRQVRLVNALCRYVEQAVEVDPARIPGVAGLRPRSPDLAPVPPGIGPRPRSEGVGGGMT